MELTPADLGLGWSVVIITSRASYASSQAPRRGGMIRRAMTGAQKPRINPLSRLWMKNTGLPEVAQAEVLGQMGGMIASSIGGFVGGSTGFLAPTIVGFANHQPVVGVMFGLAWLGMASVGLAMPGVMLRRFAHNPVTIAEVESMLNGREDPLERAYLSLIRDALKQEVSEQAAGEIRKATRALGEAIECLPALSVAVEVNAEELKEEARRVQEQARDEMDSVIAASLLRQAEALLRSAEAAERSSLVLRRNAALRKELAAQTEALRMGLASLYAGAGDMAELTRLAEQVRGVATEANAVADARSELDNYLVSGMRSKGEATATTAPLTTTLPSSTVPEVLRASSRG